MRRFCRHFFDDAMTKLFGLKRDAADALLSYQPAMQDLGNRTARSASISTIE